VFHNQDPIETLPAGMEFFYLMHLVVRDSSTGTVLYTITLNTSQPKASAFFSFSLNRTKPTEAFFTDLNSAANILMRAWSSCDMLLERKQVTENEFTFEVVNTQYIG
jgi:hypothetical protein